MKECSNCLLCGGRGSLRNVLTILLYPAEWPVALIFSVITMAYASILNVDTDISISAAMVAALLACTSFNHRVRCAECHRTVSLGQSSNKV